MEISVQNLSYKQISIKLRDDIITTLINSGTTWVNYSCNYALEEIMFSSNTNLEIITDSYS